MQALRALAVLAAFLAVWALLSEVVRWLAPHDLPGTSRLHLLLLAWLVLWWTELLSERGSRTRWRPEPEVVRGWRPWITLAGLALLVWIERDALETLLEGGELRWPGFTETLLVTGLLAPLVEEHAFRGVLWRAFEGTSTQRWASATALLGTTLAYVLWQLPFFAGAGPPSLDLETLAPHALFGLALGLVRLGFGGILPGVILHALFTLI